jgi:C4-dicarboxylate transporter DctM subunit
LDIVSEDAGYGFLMLILFGSLIPLFLLNVPLAFALGLGCFFWLIWGGTDMPLVVLAHRFMRGLDSFPLLAIPFFMLAGQFMSKGGIAQKLIDMAAALVGSFRGGLAHVNIAASMFFAGMTGSAVSDATAIGSILMPAMMKNGYRKDFTVAVTGTASVIGIVIPPSIPAIIYGLVAEISVGDLLLAGILPGIILGLSFMITAYLIAIRDGYQPAVKFSLANIWVNLRKSFLSLITVIIVVGGIYAGAFTPTEASIVAAVYAFFLAKFVYRDLQWKDLPKIFIETASISSLGIFLLGTTNIFGYIIATQGIPELILNGIMAITTNRTVILLFIIATLLALGCVLEAVAMILILVPILAPIALKLGLDPIHFGAITILATAIGLVTPPVGVCLFVACGLAKAKMSEVIRAIMPFLVASLAVLILVAFFPEISLLVPKYMRRLP